MEVNGVDEIVEVAEAAGSVLHLWDLRVEAFTGGVGDAMLELSQDV